MKGLLTALSWVELVGGTISSFIIANKLGYTIDELLSRYPTRSWGLTIEWFLASMFSTLVIYAILRGLAMTLENQEIIQEEVSNLKTEIKETQRSIENEIKNTAQNK